MNQRFGEAVTCSVLPAPGSRACIFLNFLRSQLPSNLSSFFCKLFSPQLFKISQMVSSSTQSFFDFFLCRLAVTVLLSRSLNSCTNPGSRYGNILINSSSIGVGKRNL